MKKRKNFISFDTTKSELSLKLIKINSENAFNITSNGNNVVVASKLNEKNQQVATKTNPNSSEPKLLTNVALVKETVVLNQTKPITNTINIKETEAPVVDTKTDINENNLNRFNDNNKISNNNNNDTSICSSVCYHNNQNGIFSKEEIISERNSVTTKSKQKSRNTSITSDKNLLKSFLKRRKSKLSSNYTFPILSSLKTSLQQQQAKMQTVKKVSLSSSNEVHHHYVVEIRVVFYKIGDIDTLNEKFYAEAFIEASWIDPYMDKNKQYNPKINWNPDISITNSIGDLKEQIWYNQTPHKENNNRILIDQSLHNLNQNDCVCTKMCDLNESKQNPGCIIVERRRINGTFWQLLDLKDFPGDVQNLTLSISTSKHSNEISLVHSREKFSSVNVNCFLDNQEWHIYKHVKVKEFLRECVFSIETFPAIDITVSVARRPTYYYLNAFFLIFLITLSSLAVFSMSCNIPQNRLQTSCTLLLTSVTFKWVTNRSLPSVSYMTSLDKYSLGCILIICLQCIWHGVIGYLVHLFGKLDDNQKPKCSYPFSFYDIIAFLTACGLFLILNLLFLIFIIKIGCCKRRKLKKMETDYMNNLVGKRVTRLKSMLNGI